MKTNTYILRLLTSALLLVAFACNAESSSWWDETPWENPERGFNWYPDPAEAKKEKEKEKPVEKEKPKTIYEMTTLEEIKKELERIKGVAVVNPTKENVLEFLRAQNFVMDKSALFADVSRRVVWANPDVNYSTRSPVASFAKGNERNRMNAKRTQLLNDLSKTHALLYFARSDCQYCNDQGPVLKEFSRKTSIPILTITLDGMPIPSFPDAKPDNGISLIASEGKGIERVPATFLIQKDNKSIIPLGAGVITADELGERIRVVTTTQPGEEF